MPYSSEVFMLYYVSYLQRKVCPRRRFFSIEQRRKDKQGEHFPPSSFLAGGQTHYKYIMRESVHRGPAATLLASS